MLRRYFWEFRRVMPDLLDREDAVTARAVEKLSPLERDALRLMDKAMMDKFVSDAPEEEDNMTA